MILNLQRFMLNAENTPWYNPGLILVTEKDAAAAANNT